MKHKYLFFILTLMLSITIYGCSDESIPTLEFNDASAPTLSLSTGSYVGTQTVSLSSNLEDAYIHYTLDNTTPTANSPIYETPISITETTTLKAITLKEGFNPSTITEATYTIFIDTVGVISYEDRVVIYFGLDVAWVDVHFVVNQNNQQNVRMEKNTATDLYEVTINGIISGDAIIYGFTYEASGVKSIGWSVYYASDEEQPTNDVIFTNTVIEGVNHLTISVGFTEVVNWANIHFIFNFTTQQNLPLTLNTSNNRFEITIPNFTDVDSLAYSFTYEIGTEAVTTGWQIYAINS